VPLKDGIDTFLAGIPGAISAGVQRSAEQVADLASQLAPKASGDLSRSIHVEPGATAMQRKVVAGTGLPDARANYCEYGTPISEAQPYLAPAHQAIDIGINVAAELRALAARSRAT
jgi:hypothetical protein